MPFTPLDDLITPLTRQQVQAKVYDVLALVGVSTTSWKPGGVVRTMIAAASIVLAAFSQLQAKIARSGFLELAEGPWLALVARYVYFVEKRYATFAPGTITLVNAGGGVYAVDADDLVFRNPATGKTYRNTTSFTLGALATITVPILATEAGAASTSAVGFITEMTTPLIGVSCVNNSAAVGLGDEEDPALRVRCSEKLGSLSPFGPWDAYGYAARNAVRADGSPIGVTRIRSSKDGAGNVFLYVATASGAVTGAADNLATDLGAVDDAIQKLAAPLAVNAHTITATPATLAITYRAWIYNTSGLTEDQIKAAITARLLTFMVGQPIGGNIIGAAHGKVFVDAIRTVIGATLPQIFHVELVTPSADVDLDLDAVPVLGTVTAAAITQVAPSEGLL